jgi:hypothetical protein
MSRPGPEVRLSTEERDTKASEFVSELTHRIADPERKPPGKFQGFIQDALSIWIESTFGMYSRGENQSADSDKTMQHLRSEGGGRRVEQVDWSPVGADMCGN